MEAVHRLTTINVALAKHHRSKVIAGAGGSSGGESSGGSEADDTLESKAYMSILDLLGEGQIGGLVDNSPSSIFLNDTPLVSKTGQYNFDNVTWAILTGSQTQDSLGEGFDNAEFTQSLNQLVKNATPLTFTITDPNASQVRVVVATPALISTDKKGNINGSAVRFSFALSLNSGPFEELGIGQIKGKTRSRFQREYSHILPKTTSTGKKVTSWTIRVARTSPDSSSTSVQNELYVDSYSVAVGSRLTYPNSAIVGINFNAEQFSSVPTRSYLVDGLLVKVPSNYDPKTRVYTGVWDGTFKLAVTDNPAWILYDVITNARYGLGSFIDPSLANPARLYVIGRYCDEMVDDGFGGREPRFSINTCINSRADAYQLISDISSAFNGMTYWTGGLLGYMADMPTEVSMVYSSANVIDGMFNYAGAARKDMHSVVLVTWNDPARNYQTSVEYVEDQELVERFGVRKAEITSFGCVSRGQAHRIGKWLLYTERYQSKTISFNVGIDSSFVLPGDVIQIVDADRAGSRLGGRLKKVTADFALLDAPIDTKLIKGNTTISMRLPDGKFAERLIASVGVDADTGEQIIYWGTPLTKLPLANAMWVISSPDLEPQTARIVSVGQGENPGEFSITAIPHNVNKFGHIESDLILETPNTSLVSPSVIVPTASVTIVQEARIDQGITIRDMNISWEQVANAVSYEVKYRKGEGNWLALPSTKGLSVDVQNIYQGEYQAQVVAVSSTGSKSRVTYSDPTLLEGQASTLPKLSSFTAKAAQFGIELDWLYGAGTVGVSHTEVHSSLDGKTFTLLGTYPDPLQHHAIGGLYVASTHWFKARIADKYGNFGEWSNIVSASPDVSPDKVLDVLSDSIGPSQLENSVNAKLQDAFDTSKQAVTDAKGANQAIKDEVLARTTALQTEATNRANAISTALNKEAADRTNAIATVAGAVTKEVTDRSSAISAESAARTAAITAEATARGNAITAEATARTNAITAEATARGKAITAAVSKEATDRGTAIAAEAKARGDALAAEAVARTTAISKEVTDRQAAITKEVTDRNAAISVETTARTKAITDKAAEINADVAAKIKTVNDGITKEITDRTAGDDAVRGELTTYKSSNDTAVAAVVKDVKTVTTAQAATASDVSGLQSTMTAVQGTLSKKADAAALSSLDTKVETINGQVTSQGTSITTLNANLVTTNNNVTAAQNAANAANTLAGGKGKVIVQAAAPAVADRLAQNLWIDITGGANTPKRWLTNAWVAVTDKVATDAAAAAANALRVANTKADAAAFNTLDAKVTTIDGVVTAQGTSIAKLQSDLTTTDTKAGTAVANAATAQQTANTAVTAAGANASRITELDSSFKDYQTANDAALAQTNANVSTVEKTSTDADKALGVRIDTVVATAKTDKTDVTALVTAETSARTSADTALSGRIDALTASTNTELGKTNAAVTAEQTARTTADTALGKRIDTVTANAATDKSTLQTAITTEQTARTTADTALGKRIDAVTATAKTDKADVTALITAETTARTTADAAMTSRVDTLTTTVTNNNAAVTGSIAEVAESVTDLEGSTNTKFSSLESQLSNTNKEVGVVKAAAANAQTTANTAVNSSSANASAISALDTKFTAKDSDVRGLVTSEQTARSSADVALGKRIDTVVATAKTDKADLTSLVSTETTARTNADSALGQRIDTLTASTNTELGKTNAAVTAEQTARTTADTALGKRIDAVVATAKTDKSDVTALVTAETTARTAADSALGSRIDTLNTTVANNDTKVTGSIADVAKSVTTLEGNTNSKISNLQSSLDTTNVNVGKKADTTALNALTTRVTNTEKENTTQANSITSLKNSMEIEQSRGANLIHGSFELEGAYTLGSKFELVDGGYNNTAKCVQSIPGTGWGEIQFRVLKGFVGPRTFKLSFATKIIEAHASLGSVEMQLAYMKAGDTNYTAYPNVRRGSLGASPVDSDWVITEGNITLKADVTQVLIRIVSSQNTTGGKFLLDACSVVDITEANEAQKKAEANSVAITDLNSQVGVINGTLTSQASSISRLQSDLTATDAKAGTALTNAATAQSTANTGVTKAEAAASATNTLKVAYEAKVANLDATDKANAAAIVKTNTDLTNAQTALSNADAALGNRIDSITTTVQNNDTAVRGQIKDVADSVTTLTGNTNSKITSLQSSLDTTNANVAKKFDATAIGNYYTKAQTEDKAATIAAGKVDEYKAALKIGGANLLTGSKDFSGSAWVFGNNVIDNTQTYKGFKVIKSNGQWAGTRQRFTIAELPVGTEITLSFYAKADETNKGKQLHVYNEGTPNNKAVIKGTTASAKNTTTLTTEWQRYSATYTVHDNTSVVSLRAESPTATDINYYCGFKLEIGNVATEWTEHSKDIQDRIDVTTTSINTTNTEVSRVNGVVVAQGSSIAKLQSDLTAVDAKAGTAVTNAATAQNTANTAVTGNASTASSLSQLKTAYEANVIDVNGKITAASNKAASDLTSAQTTLANADKALGSRIDNLTTTVTNNNTAVTGQIQTVANSVTTLEGNTNTKINALKSSMTSETNNLILGTETPKSIVGTNRVNQVVGCWYFESNKTLAGLFANSKLGEEITFSCDWTATEGSTGLFYPQYVTSPWSLGVPSIVIGPDRLSGRIEYTFALNAGHLSSVANRLDFRCDNLVGTLTISNAMYQKSSKATAWTRAAGEVNSAIATAQTTANSGVTKADAAASATATLKSAYDAKVIELDGKITTAGNKAASDLSSAQTTLANADKALGTRIDNLTTTVGNNDTAVKGQIKTVSDSVTTLSGSVNTRVDTLTASIKAANVASGDLIPNPTFDPAYNQMGFTVVPSTNAGVPAGCPFPYVAKLTTRDHFISGAHNIPCKTGDVFEISALVACGAGAADFNLYTYRRQNATTTTNQQTANGGNTKAALNAGTWQRVTWRWAVTEHAYPFFTPFLQVNQNSPFSTVWYVTDWHCVNVTAAAQAKATADANATAINATNTEVGRVNGEVVANTSKISKLQSDLTTVDAKTNTAISNAATAQTTANTAVTNNAATAGRVDTLTTTVTNNNTTVTGKIKDVADSVTTLSGNTNTKLNQLESGLRTANGAISTKAEQSSLNSTNSTLNTLSGKVETQAQSINTLTSKTATMANDISNAELLARAMSSGKLVYGDPTFKTGTNGVGLYNNANNGNVIVARVAKQSGNPTSSGFEMRITSTGAGSPGLGGFVQVISARASAVFLIKYIICLPLGYALYTAANAMGDGASDKFIGNVNGTGKYETYYRLIKCGSTGSFSSTGFVYTAGPTPTAAAPLNWYLASIEAYDTTDFDDMTPQLRTTVAEVQSKVNTLTTNTGATAEKVESMSAYFDAGETVDSGNLTADGGTNGAVRWTYHAMITEGDMANAKAIDNMKAEVGGTLAEWGQVINSEVKEGMSALSEQVNHVSTTLGDQTTRIDTVMASVDGIYGKYMVTIDNNGVLSNFQLVSERGENQEVVSTFGVNADNFYIGSPTTGKRPFIVTTEPRVINGVTYPPGTWIDSAYIAEASIKMAHIDTASITSLSAVSATIGTLRTATTGARTEISDNLIKVYDENNVLRVRIGVWDDQDF